MTAFELDSRSIQTAPQYSESRIDDNRRHDAVRHRTKRHQRIRIRHGLFTGNEDCVLGRTRIDLSAESSVVSTALELVVITDCGPIGSVEASVLNPRVGEVP